MSVSLYKYRIYCQTEQVYTYVWGESTPLACPINSSHTISSSTITILDEVSEKIVAIKQESVKTGGNFKIKGFSHICPANSTTIFPVSWPFNITVMNVRIYSEISQVGDTVNAIVSPDTIVGTLTSSCSSGVTTVSVNSTAVMYSCIGFFCKVGTEDLGMILSIDSINSTISFQNPTSVEYTTGTYYKIETKMIENYPLGMVGESIIGESNIGGTHLPANTITNVIYTNNSNTQKIHKYCVEYLY